MNIETNSATRVQSIIEHLVSNDQRYIDDTSDLLLWGYYGPEVLSQFGYGYSGAIFRQHRDSTKMTVKVTDSGVPLVAFITSASTTGCVRRFFDLLHADKLKWQKDKYPWI